MSFFSSIAAAIEAEAVKVEASLASIWTQLKPAVVASAEDLASAAMTAVLAQIPSVVAGTVKFDAAASQVVTALGSQGKTAAANLVTAAVQLSYNMIQSLRPATPAS